MNEDCKDCRHAEGRRCLRSPENFFTQRYERRHTDDDFCGPSARFFVLRTTNPKDAA